MSAAGHEAHAAARQLACLQALRGVAAMMVVLYHTGTMYATHTGLLLWGNSLRAGFAGVDVFFVLSGMVIHWVHGRDIGQPEQLRGFVVKRAFRLLPVYWVVVLLKLAKDPTALGLGGLAAAWLLLPVPAPFINVSWTLSYELLFYATFALLIVLPRARWLPLVVLLACGLLPAPAAAPGSLAHDALRFFFNTHLLEFGFGMAVSWALQRGPLPPPRVAAALAVAGLVALVAAAVAGTRLSLQSGPGSAYELAELRSNAVFDAATWLFGLPAALMVAGLAALELRGVRSVASWRPLAWVGDVSYSLYLTHGFVIHLMLGLAPFKALVLRQPAALALAWVAALLLAGCFYRLVERPALALGRRWLQRGAVA